MKKDSIFKIIMWIVATILLSFIFIPLVKFFSGIIGIGMSFCMAYFILSWIGSKFNIKWLK
jgi:uncharacterized membrane protein